MRLVRSSQNKLVFHLGKREKQLLLAVLELFPRLPSAHQPLSKSAKLPNHEANQKLLEEGLAEHRAEIKRNLASFLADRKKLEEQASGWQLTLSPSEAEWLLQVLNDVRVGSWVRLGSPEDHIEKITEKSARDIWAMEAAGQFQMLLLSAMEGEHL